MLASTFGVSGGGGSNLFAPLMLSALLVPSQAALHLLRAQPA